MRGALIESEKKLDQKLKKMVETKLKGLCLKLEVPFFTGLPDRLCLIPYDVAFFVEVKTTKQKPRKRQLLVHARLRALGFTVFVVDKSEDIEKIFQKYFQD